MLSCISNSESRTATKAIVALVGALLFYCALLEIVTRIGLDRISHNQNRVYADYRAAKSLTPSKSAGVPTLLLVGNSLLLQGVDRVMLKQQLASSYQVFLLPIENTQFEDWYFGLRRLFAEGSRPATVVVCLSTRQLISRTTNGEYFAHYLMRPQDLFAVKNEAQLDNTVTSNYFFAHWSRWLGTRAQIRNWLLQELMPNLTQLIGYFPGRIPPMPPSSEVVQRALPHLLALSDLCRHYNSTLLVLVPPIRDIRDASAEVQEAGARAGIPVVIPMRPSETTTEDFTDGFHLNPNGAARFTQRLVVTLQAFSSTKLIGANPVHPSIP